ncbi:MAG: acyltransferase [Saccharofermentans sp.]|nr:acyltransferase [Saccharofermentans sp.]
MTLNIFLMLLFGLILYSCLKNCLFNSSECNSFSIESTESLRGIATVIIIMSHIAQYETSFENVVIGGEITRSFVLTWGGVGVSLFFLLSGFGCYLSINKSSAPLIWSVKHAIRVIFHFIVVYIIVILSSVLFLKEEKNIGSILVNFLLLRIPNSTTWYLKAQILFYLILGVSVVISRKQSHTLVILGVTLYALIGKFLLCLSDFWWKTSLCFAAGCCIAKYKVVLLSCISKIYVRTIIVLLGAIAYVCVINDYQYRLLIQLPAYVLVAFSIVELWNWIGRKSEFYSKTGQISLDLYLVHIAYVEAVFGLNINVNIKFLFFLLLIIVESVISYCISEKLYKFFNSKLITLNS